MLETPLDKVEPYGLFKDTLLSKLMLALLQQSEANNRLPELQHEQPRLYQDLTKILNPDEQQIVQAVIVQAEANAIAAQALQAAAASQQTNGGAH